MTIDELKKALESDAELLSKWKEQISKVNPKDRETQINAVKDFAKANGFELSYEDIVMKSAEGQELDMEELEAVTGGWGPGDCGQASTDGAVVCPLANEWCAFDYWCWLGWK